MSRPDWRTATADDFPVGSKLRPPRGGRSVLCHVRSHVDGMVVVRWWTRKHRWAYEVESPAALAIYTRESVPL